MSDKVDGFLVVLSHDISEEHAKRIMEAIEMLEGVKVVTKHVHTPETDIAYHRFRITMQLKLLNMFNI